MNDQLGMLDHIQRVVIDLAIQFGPKVIVAIAIIVAGVYAGRWVGKAVDRAIRKFNLEPPVRQLLVRIVRIFVLMLFAIMALQNLGIELLPLIAGLGVAGAGIALAMQGVLGNMMAGLTIIFTRPFRVGEYISIVGEEGVVDNISLFSTVLNHTDLSRVVIPNRKIVGEILHNYGTIRQIEVLVGVAYDTDLDLALALASEVLNGNMLVLRDPAYAIGIGALTNFAVNISLKPWVNASDFAAVKSEISKAVVQAYTSRNIVIPVFQNDARIALSKN
jgi:small conductance mechanosensitive channel